MTDRECIRIEIAECPWTEELKFQVRCGDLDGSSTASNLDSMEKVLEHIKLEMELNWPELAEERDR